MTATRATSQTSAPLRHLTMTTYQRRARGVVDQVREGWLDLDPPYQRGQVWSLAQQQGLVRSWLSGIAIPSLILNDRLSAGYRDPAGTPVDASAAIYGVIDGKQRISTAVAWYDDEFAVPASWFDPDHIATTEATDDGPYLRYSGLTRTGQSLFDSRAMLPTCETQVPTLPEEAEIYLLINGAGTPQTSQDLENAADVAHGAR